MINIISFFYHFKYPPFLGIGRKRGLTFYKGKIIVAVVPFPSSLSITNIPLWPFMISSQIANPNPVPESFVFPLKNFSFTIF